MKIVKLDRKNNILKGIIKSQDDLLLLSYLIEEGDKLVAFSKRKIDINGNKEIKRLRIGIDVERSKSEGKDLQVSGKIFFSSDPDIPLHRYHTITLSKGNGFLLKKKSFLNFQLKMIEESQHKAPKVFICVYEAGHAIFYTMTNYSLKKLYEVNQNIAGKRFKNKDNEEFFLHLVNSLKNEFNRRKWDLFIVAGTAINNANLKEKLGEKGIIYETVSYADTGIRELLAKDKINQLLRRSYLARQNDLINEYIDQIGRKNDKFVYGKEEIMRRLDVDTPLQVLVTAEKAAEEKELIYRLDSMGADIILFTEADESKSLLENFGGIIVKFS